MPLTNLPGDHPVALHPQVTVLTGAGDEKDRWIERIRAAAAKAAGGTLLPEAVLAPGDLPGARMVTVEAGAKQSSQRVEAARGALEAARSAEESARNELLRAQQTERTPVPDTEQVRSAQERLATAQAAAESIGAELAAAALEAEQEMAGARSAFEEQVAERRHRVEELDERRAGLAERRAELEAVLAEPDPPDVSAVEAALAAYSEATKGSTEPLPESSALAQRWADAQRRLAEAPGAEPPAWLLVPAEEALDRAREVLRNAEQSAGAASMDADAAARIEDAHRRVLDAEQRMMDRPGMLSKRKVDAALDAEREALEAVGVRSYNDYLQIMANRDSDDAERRITAARAAVADAEAVWEELHRPLPTPERSAIEIELASLREEAAAALGRTVPDDELEAALRGARADDGGEALAAVADAVRAAGGDPGEDPASAAEHLVRDVTARQRRREDAETGLAAADREAAWVDKTWAELSSELQAEEPQPSGDLAARLAEVRARSEAANDEVVAAEQELQLAREQAAPAEGATDVAADAEARVAEAAVARERAEAELRRLEEDDARRDSPTGPVEVADLKNVVPLEAELYVLGRLASMRATTNGSAGAPLVVDDGFGDLDDDARGRILDLLARASTVVQVVVVSDESYLVTWAERLGSDLAAVTPLA